MISSTEKITQNGEAAPALPSDYFHVIACPICGTDSSICKMRLSVPYDRLKQKNSLDYSPIGISKNSILSVQECTECGFVFANPRVKPEHLSLVYNECKSNLYKKKQNGPEKKAKKRARVVSYIHPFLELLDQLPADQEEISYFDFGCGFGESLSIARVLGMECYGVDIDLHRVEECKRKEFNVATPDDFRAKFPQFQADLIMFQGILEHLIEVRPVFEFLKSISKPGTLIYMNGLTPRLIDLETKGGVYAKSHFIEHVNFFPIKTIDRLMSQFGFFPVRWNRSTVLRGPSAMAKETLSYFVNGSKLQAHQSGVFRRIYRME